MAAARMTSSAARLPPIVRMAPAAIADHVEAGDAPMLVQHDVPRPEGDDEAVDVPSGLHGAVAGQDEAGPHVVREGRHHGADALAVEQLPGTGTRRAHALQVASAWRLRQQNVARRGEGIIVLAMTLTPASVAG